MSTFPREDGYYWMRPTRAHQWQVVQVLTGKVTDGKPAVLFTGLADRITKDAFVAEYLEAEWLWCGGSPYQMQPPTNPGGGAETAYLINFVKRYGKNPLEGLLPDPAPTPTAADCLSKESGCWHGCESPENCPADQNKARAMSLEAVKELHRQATAALASGCGTMRVSTLDMLELTEVMEAAVTTMRRVVAAASRAKE